MNNLIGPFIFNKFLQYFESVKKQKNEKYKYIKYNSREKIIDNTVIVIENYESRFLYIKESHKKVDDLSILHNVHNQSVVTGNGLEQAIVGSSSNEKEKNMIILKYLMEF